MTQRTSALLLGFGFIVLGCDAFKSPNVDPRANNNVPSFSPSPAPTAPVSPTLGCPSFAGNPVDPFVPFQKTLYFWASPAEVEDMKATGDILLDRSADTLDDIFLTLSARFSQGLYPATASDAALTVLGSTVYRQTWPNPWASALPQSSDSKGAPRDILVRVVIRDDAWFVSDASNLSVRNAQGATVSPDLLNSQSQRLGVVLHSLNPEGSCAAVTPGTASRSYTIVSPYVVESWSVGSDPILARWDADKFVLNQYLEGVRSSTLGFFEAETEFSEAVQCRWFGQSDSCTGDYLSALQNDNSAYLLETTSLASLLDNLGDLPAVDEYEYVAPDLGFGGMGGAQQ